MALRQSSSFVLRELERFDWIAEGVVEEDLGATGAGRTPSRLMDRHWKGSRVGNRPFLGGVDKGVRFFDRDERRLLVWRGVVLINRGGLSTSWVEIELHHRQDRQDLPSGCFELAAGRRCKGR